ncbi:MAG: class I SAM-dependent methyltransferase [Candidatus Saccharimonadaceae bacterium]
MLLFYIVGIIIVFVGLSAFFGAPYLPSHRKDVKRLFDELTPLSKDDVVLDIGSGDGLVLREVSRRGARAVGYEIHPLFVGISKVASLGDSRVQVRWANAWSAPFPKSVTLIYIFSVGRDGPKLVKKMQNEADALDRPLTIVCYGNALPKLVPVQTLEPYYLYVFEPLHLR